MLGKRMALSMEADRACLYWSEPTKIVQQIVNNQVGSSWDRGGKGHGKSQKLRGSVKKKSLERTWQGSVHPQVCINVKRKNGYTSTDFLIHSWALTVGHGLCLWESQALIVDRVIGQSRTTATRETLRVLEGAITFRSGQGVGEKRDMIGVALYRKWLWPWSWIHLDLYISCTNPTFHGRQSFLFPFAILFKGYIGCGKVVDIVYTYT